MIKKLSNKALSYLKIIEPASSTPYTDAENKWVVGYNHTGDDFIHDSNISYSDAEIEEWLKEDIRLCELEVIGMQRLNKIDLNQDQFDALVLLVFRMGIDFRTNNIRHAIIGNPNDPEVPKLWLGAITVSNIPSRGLLRRRLFELMLYYSFDKDFAHVLKNINDDELFN